MTRRRATASLQLSIRGSPAQRSATWIGKDARLAQLDDGDQASCCQVFLLQQANLMR